MIIVTGAGGNVGSATVAALTEKGARFKAAYRKPSEIDSAKAQGIDAVQVDYSDTDGMTRAFEGADRIFYVNVATPDFVQHTANVIEASKRAGIKQLAKLSVWGAETEAFEFARAHREAERVIEASGLPWTYVQPNGFFQNLLGLAPLIQSQSLFTQAVADPAVSEQDVHDIGAVAAAILTSDGHDGKAYRISGSETITGTHKAEILSELLGRKIQFFAQPAAEWKKGAMQFGVPESLADAVITLMRFYEKGGANEIVDTVPRLTGKPARTFRQFATDHIAAFRGAKAAGA